MRRININAVKQLIFDESPRILIKFGTFLCVIVFQRLTHLRSVVYIYVNKKPVEQKSNWKCMSKENPGLVKRDGMAADEHGLCKGEVELLNFYVNARYSMGVCQYFLRFKP